MMRLPTDEEIMEAIIGCPPPVTPPISPSPLPNQPDTDSQTLKGGGDSIYVNSITGDGS